MPIIIKPLMDVLNPVTDTTTTEETSDSTSSPVIRKIVELRGNDIVVEMSDGTRKLRTGGTISWRYCNPGNIKWGPFAEKYGAIGPGWGNHAVFPSNEIGQRAKYALLFSSERGYDSMTLTAAISKYAPASDKGKGVPSGGNNPREYAAYIANKANVATVKVLRNFTEEERIKMLEAMQFYEGWKVGLVKSVF